MLQYCVTSDKMILVGLVDSVKLSLARGCGGAHSKNSGSAMALQSAAELSGSKGFHFRCLTGFVVLLFQIIFPNKGG